MKLTLSSLFGAVALSTAMITGAVAKDLTISIWGGGYAEEFKKQVVEPFEKETGATVRVEGGLSSERLAKLMATHGRNIDLIYLTDYQMAEAKKRNLLEPVDPGKLSNLSDLYDFARDPLGGNTCPAFTVAAVGIAYNKDQFPEPPQSWKELFSTKLPGKAGYVDMSVSYAPLLLAEVAKLYGGGIDNVDPAFKQIEEAKSHLQFFTRQEILQSVNQGDVSLTPQLNIFVKKDDSVPLRFAWPKDGGLGVLNLVCMVKGTDVPDLAQKFIDFHLSRAVQERMLTAQGETPVNKMAERPKSSSFNIIPQSDIGNLQFFDVNKILASRDEWMKRWQEQVLAQ
jgi:putative spermidine/putrescine transport system substrate-binding protein